MKNFKNWVVLLNYCKKFGRKGFYSTFKQCHPTNVEITKTQTINENCIISYGKELKTIFAKNDLIL